jgi:uncharacterized protein Yka (UPF0111/DUF47 family)
MFSIQNLLGKEGQFLDLLQASAREAVASVKTLSEYFQHPEHLAALEQCSHSRRRDRAIADEISEALCETFVTTLEREDIESLSVALCKIPKTAHKIAQRLSLAPQFLEGYDLRDHLALLEKAAETVLLMMTDLRKGMHIERIRFHNDQLQAIEANANRKLLELLERLYNGPSDIIRSVFLKDIFELLEKVFDGCADAGKVMNHIILKNS